MKRLLQLATLLLLFAAGTYAQSNGVYSDVAWRFSTGFPNYPVGGAKITVCTYPATSPSIPCTNLATIYGGPTTSVVMSNPFTADQAGNFSFWAAPGNYTVTITGNSVNPYSKTVTVPCGAGFGCTTGAFNRLNSVGTPLKTSDFSIIGWGTGATITSVQGTDSVFLFTVTAGTSPSINPTVTLTFHDGPWTSIYFMDAKWVGGTGNATDIQTTNNLNAITMTYLSLPVATKTYVISGIVAGSSNLVPAQAIASLNPVVQNPITSQVIMQPVGTNLFVNRFEQIRFADQFSGLQAAVTDCTVDCEIYIPAGTSTPASPISISSSTVWIHGAGMGQTIIQPTSALASALFSITAASVSVKFSDLTIDMTNAPAQTALAFNGVSKPVLENVQIFYPSTTGTGTAISMVATAEMHATNIIMKGAGICIDENGNASGEDFFHSIVCEDPGTYGYHRTQTTSTDVGGEYLFDFKVTNPDNRTTAQGFVVTSSASNTGSPFFCYRCIGDNMQGGHTYQIHNMVNIFLEGIWATNGAPLGSNFAALNLDTVTNAFVRGGYFASFSRDLVFTGTDTTVELTNNLFAGTNTNIYSTGATVSNIQLLNPVFSAGTPISASDLSLLTNNTSTTMNANGWHVGVSGSQGAGPTLSICDKDVGDATPCAYIRTTAGGSGAFQLLNNSFAQLLSINQTGTVATLGANRVMFHGFSGNCAMSGSTTCTFSITASFTSTPLTFVSIDAASTVPATANSAKCSVSGTTVTITAGISNSLTWDCLLVGAPD